MATTYEKQLYTTAALYAGITKSNTNPTVNTTHKMPTIPNPSNPAHEVTFPPNYVNLYEQKPKAIKSFGIRISPLLESANIKRQNIENVLHQIFQLVV